MASLTYVCKGLIRDLSANSSNMVFKVPQSGLISHMAIYYATGNAYIIYDNRPECHHHREKLV